jgi:CRP/FNR family transcriptional regulator
MRGANRFETHQNETTITLLPCHLLSQDLQGLQDVKLSSIHPRGDILFAEGQPAHGVFLLSSGRVKISVASAEGKTMILRVARPGDLLGVNAVLQDRPFEATAQAIDRCRIDFIPRSDFVKLMDKSKTARVGVSMALCSELSESLERTRSLLLSQSTAEKLARFLLKWCEDFGEPINNEIRLNHGLTQEEIAQMICASRETVSRLFAELKRKEVVRVNGVGIFVRNRAALEAIANASGGEIAP